jgi:hypothetical protein
MFIDLAGIVHKSCEIGERYLPPLNFSLISAFFKQGSTGILPVGVWRGAANTGWEPILP